jgi:hypothetical protein
MNSKDDRALFLRYCVGFTVFAIGLAFVVRDFSLGFMPGFVANNLGTARMMTTGPLAVPLVAALVGYFYINRDKALEIFSTLLGTTLLCSSFILLKTAIPLVVPFWADPMLAAWDRALFGGVDGYVLAHDFAPWFEAEWAALLYMPVWAITMILFPTFVVLVERDRARKLRYLRLYVLCWVALGLITAALFSSAGPIYYEQVTDEPGFSELRARMAAVGFDQTAVRALQDGLWSAYEADDGQQLRGSGISAFPSMHVAVATLWACYLAERFRWLAPLGVAYAAVILFLSVFTGWHYAVDGIASALAVIAACAVPVVMRRTHNVSCTGHQPTVADRPTA